MTDREQIDAAADQFPETFGLRPFPGKLFTINREQSYICGGELQLYVFTERGAAFSKGTVEELKAVAVGDGLRPA